MAAVEITAKAVAALKVHPAAELFPPLAGNELQELANDIQANGLISPIVLHEAMILDGRNRLRACELGGVEPRFIEWAGTSSPTQWVLSVNLRRRHLDESQRALVGARAKERLEVEGRKRQTELAGAHGSAAKNLGANLRQGRHPKSAEQAAKLTNVSARSVEHAAKVLKKGDPELILAVEQGKIAVSAAAKVAALPAEEQREAVRTERVKEPAKRPKKTLGTATEPAPLMVVHPLGFAALRKGQMTRAKEAAPLRCLVGLLRSGNEAWAGLVRAWHDEHREDMEFALAESDEVERDFLALTTRFETFIASCDENRSSDEPQAALAPERRYARTPRSEVPAIYRALMQVARTEADLKVLVAGWARHERRDMAFVESETKEIVEQLHAIVGALGGLRKRCDQPAQNSKATE